MGRLKMELYDKFKYKNQVEIVSKPIVASYKRPKIIIILILLLIIIMVEIIINTYNLLHVDVKSYQPYCERISRFTFV